MKKENVLVSILYLIFVAMIVFICVHILTTPISINECKKVSQTVNYGLIKRVDYRPESGGGYSHYYSQAWIMTTDKGYIFEDKKPWNIGDQVTLTTSECEQSK